jgi:DNA-binding NarL/FixJ family response regulator
MDGYELGRQLRALRRLGQPLGLIVLTGYGQEKDQTRSRDAGFDAHLVKPVHLNTLLSTLSRVLGCATLEGGRGHTRSGGAMSEEDRQRWNTRYREQARVLEPSRFFQSLADQLPRARGARAWRAARFRPADPEQPAAAFTPIGSSARFLAQGATRTRITSSIHTTPSVFRAISAPTRSPSSAASMDNVLEKCFQPVLAVTERHGPSHGS